MGSKYITDLQRICIYVAQDCAGTNALLLLLIITFGISVDNKMVILKMFVYTLIHISLPILFIHR